MPDQLRDPRQIALDVVGAQLEAAKELLREVEWEATGDGRVFCPICRAVGGDGATHDPCCKLAAILAGRDDC